MTSSYESFTEAWEQAAALGCDRVPPADPPPESKALTRPPGRPSDYNEPVATSIIERMIDGESLRHICRDPAMPNKATVLRWVVAHQEFERLYRFALEARADGRADEMLEIADDASADYTAEPGEDGAPPTLRLDKEAIARSKLRIDTRKWLMAKEMPRKYGELPELPKPIPGDGAQEINPGTGSSDRPATVIENDPLHSELNAWAKVRKA